MIAGEFLAQFVSNEKYADVTFVVGKESVRIPAHRFILAASSPVFEVCCIFASVLAHWGCIVLQVMLYPGAGVSNVEKLEVCC